MKNLDCQKSVKFLLTIPLGYLRADEDPSFLKLVSPDILSETFFFRKLICWPKLQS